MIDEWIKDIKATHDPDTIGMILVHNGVVRGTSKTGTPVTGMRLTYDRALLESTITDFKKRDGITEIRAWINEGDLAIGDDIMYVLVAGRFRTDVLPALQELLGIIKKDVVKEQETAG